MNRRWFLSAAATLPFVKLPPAAGPDLDVLRLRLFAPLVYSRDTATVHLGYAITRKAIDDNLRRVLFHGHTDPVTLLSAEDGDA